mgnify:FL=1
MFRRLWYIAAVALLSGCASLAPTGKANCPKFLVCAEEARVERVSLQKLLDLPDPNQKAVIAIYDFKDLTGQRKPSDRMALFSTAVTQGAENYVIQAFRAAGRGNWFAIVERSGLDNLTRERQIIKSTRETYDGEGSSALKPLLFAGIIIEGGIISCESDIKTGGSGARYLGIGSTNQYRKDDVTVSMRAVLVQTGEVMLNVSVSKSILSASTSKDVFRFIDTSYTELVEIETGYTDTEATGYAVRAAIEAAVFELIDQGLDKRFWDFDYSQLSSEEVAE